MSQHTFGIPGQQREQLELFWRQPDFRVAAEQAMTVVVDGEIADADASFRGLVGREHTFQRHSDTGDQFVSAERLGDVVVRAELERRDLVGFSTARRQDNDWHSRRHPDAPADFRALDIRQPEIQHDQVGRLARDARAARADVVHHAQPALSRRVAVPQVVTVHDVAFATLPEGYGRVWRRLAARRTASRSMSRS